MTDQSIDLETLTDLCTPWCIHVVATLRIADHLAAGVAAIDQLAVAAQCDPDTLGRVLRHLASKGVFVEPEAGRFALNRTAQGLLHRSQGQFLDLDGIGGRMAGAWGSLLTAVRTGRPGYADVFGLPFWEDLDAHPEVAASFDAMMGSAGHGSPNPNVRLTEGWESIRHVVDVGGGTGALLAEILRAHPNVHGTLVDLPRTVARAAEVFRTAGVDDRTTIFGQSFFDPLPSGADLYVLKNVLADWPDREALVLLSRCADAARPDGRVVILGGVSPDADGGPSPELLMLVLVGGKARSLAVFRSLARQAGLEVRVAGFLPSGRFAVECQPV